MGAMIRSPTAEKGRGLTCPPSILPARAQHRAACRGCLLLLLKKERQRRSQLQALLLAPHGSDPAALGRG